MTEQPERALSIVISAMGGQGGGVLSRWIVDVAEQGGYVAQATSVPGVAQRTGATIYYIELFPRAAAEAAGSDPVLALMPIPGEVDLLIAAELVEAGRAVVRGLVTPDRTTVVASSHREYSIAEKAALGDGVADAAEILEAVERAACRCVTFDMAERAAATESVISSVLLGAVAGAGQLPFERASFEAAIRRGGIAVEPTLAGFAAGFAAAAGVAGFTAEDGAAGSAPTSQPAAHPPPASPRGRVLLERVNEAFPRAARPLVLEGVRRVADYQDLRYADAYLDLLEPIAALEDGRDGGDDADGGDGGDKEDGEDGRDGGSDADGGDGDDGDEGGSHRLTSETARHLALWMSYEDVARVADLKTRSERFARMRQEVRAEPDQLVYTVDFLHPSVQEIADVLPAPIGRFIMEREGLRGAVDWVVNRGRRISTGKLGGFLLLYSVAGLRRLRRFSYRYQREMLLIETWLSRINGAAPSDYDLAVEIARCQRLIKGYGDTHERGMRSFDAIMDVLPALTTHEDAAGAVRKLSEAALADEHGVALQAALADATPAE